MSAQQKKHPFDFKTQYGLGFSTQYRDGMRVYVDSQYYAWEFNAIKEAILDGTLTYTPKPAVNAHDLLSMEIAG